MDVFETEPVTSEEVSDESVQAFEPGPGDSGSIMTAAEAIEKLKRGEPIERTRVVGLKLKGEFTEPVRFSKVTLIQFSIEKATFAQEVAFEHCTLERPRFTRKSHFEKGLSLTGSTLIKAELRGMTVKGAFRCDNIRTRGRFLLEAARFEGRLRFWEAQFQGWVELQAFGVRRRGRFSEHSRGRGLRDQRLPVSLERPLPRRLDSEEVAGRFHEV